MYKEHRGKTIYVRWMGAFRAPKNESGERYSLLESLLYEVNNPHEVACEPVNFLQEKSGSQVYKARIGLLIDKSCIRRKFKRDCWSEYDENGRLVVSGKGTKLSGHAEAWTDSNPIYLGVVIKKDWIGGFYNMKRETQENVRDFIEAFPEMKIYFMDDNGKLREVSKEAIKLK